MLYCNQCYIFFIRKNDESVNCPKCFSLMVNDVYVDKYKFIFGENVKPEKSRIEVDGAIIETEKYLISIFPPKKYESR